MLPSTTWAPMSVSSAGDMAFTDAFVPTGMKAGVSIGPCAVWSVAARAAPSVACTSNAPGCIARRVVGFERWD